MLGRHRKALAQLGKLFKNGDIGKTYWAVVEGGPEADEGTIDLPLGRLDATRGWWMKPDPDGQPAVTKWKVMGEAATRAAGLTVDLARARTADRPHASAARALRRDGLADRRRTIYGNAPRTGGPVLHLHAREIVVPLYKNRDPIRVVAPVPQHMRERLAALRLEWRAVDVVGSVDSVDRRFDPLRRSAVVLRRRPSCRRSIRRELPGVGRLLRSTMLAGSHSFERMIALVHWK